MRINVHLPDGLAADVKEQLPDLNVSGLLQEALRSLLDCDHDSVVCADCGEPVDAVAVAGEAMGEFYAALLWAWEDLVDRGGTAEGAARVAKDVAVRMGVPRAETRALPRPTRAARAS